LWCAIAEVFLFQVGEFLNRLVNVDVVCEVHGVTPFTYRNSNQRDGIRTHSEMLFIANAEKPASTLENR
jgi:hypothetical protein